MSQGFKKKNKNKPTKKSAMGIGSDCRSLWQGKSRG